MKSTPTVAFVLLVYYYRIMLCLYYTRYFIYHDMSLCQISHYGLLYFIGVFQFIAVSTFRPMRSVRERN